MGGGGGGGAGAGAGAIPESLNGLLAGVVGFTLGSTLV